MIEIIYSVCKCDPCLLGGKGGLTEGEFGIEGALCSIVYASYSMAKSMT